MKREQVRDLVKVWLEKAACTAPEAYDYRIDQITDDIGVLLGRERRAERRYIVDAIRERGNKWAELGPGREESAARLAMYDVATELEDGKLAP